MNNLRKRVKLLVLLMLIVQFVVPTWRTAEAKEDQRIILSSILQKSSLYAVARVVAKSLNSPTQGPSPFLARYPLRDITGVSAGTVFDWDQSIGAQGIVYYICVDTRNDFTCNGPSGNGWSQARPVYMDRSDATNMYIDLEPNTDYYWLVKARDAAGNWTAMNGGWSHFKTGNLPGTFGKIGFPHDGDYNVRCCSTVLYWNSSHHGPFYTYCFSEVASSGTRCVGEWKMTMSTSVSVPLEGNKKYCWQVRASRRADTLDQFTPANGNGGHWCFRT